MNGQSSSQSPSSQPTGTLDRWVGSDGTAHEKCLLGFWVGGTPFGMVPFDPGDWPSLCWQRMSIAYFCPECGEVWARLPVLNSKGELEIFEVRIVACEKHSDQWNVPGSLLSQGLESLLELMPHMAVKREFEVHLRQTETP